MHTKYNAYPEAKHIERNQRAGKKFTPRIQTKQQASSPSND